MISDERIMGFVEGEGCFSIGVQRYLDKKPRKTEKRNKIKNPRILGVRPNFRITISEKDRRILDMIKERFNVGQIYVQDRSKIKNNQNVAYYYVQTLSDIIKIDEFFKDKDFHTAKGNDYQLWHKCIEIIKSRRHLTREGFLEICKLRDQMNGNRNARKQNIDKIIAILNQPDDHILAHNKTQNYPLIST